VLPPGGLAMLAAGISSMRAFLSAMVFSLALLPAASFAEQADGGVQVRKPKLMVCRSRWSTAAPGSSTCR